MNMLKLSLTLLGACLNLPVYLRLPHILQKIFFAVLNYEHVDSNTDLLSAGGCSWCLQDWFLDHDCKHYCINPKLVKRLGLKWQACIARLSCAVSVRPDMARECAIFNTML